MLGVNDDTNELIEANLLQKIDGLEQYLREMSKSGIYGDGIILSAAAKLYNRPIQVLLLDADLTTVQDSHYLSDVSVDQQSMTLGYYALSLTGKRNHYISLARQATGTEIIQFNVVFI